MPVVASVSDGHRLEPASFAEWARTPNEMAPPLRLHLLNQILLI
jgi:hypothetical protein